MNRSPHPRTLGALTLAGLLAATAAAATAAPRTVDAPRAANAPHDGPTLVRACDGRDGWSDAAPPARVFGNTWYVGTCGITALLVTSDDGHVLIDSGPADAAPLVLAGIRQLGFRPQDVRWIVTSHEHHDHAAGLAALQKATGARIAALASARRVLESGRPSLDDPQAGHLDAMAPVAIDRQLADGDSVIVGRMALTVRETPAHSPGSASWSWQSCDERFACRMIAYADSATTIATPGYRFIDHPDRIARIRTGLSRIGAMPCDVLITPHPEASNLLPRLAGRAPLVDTTACNTYAAAAVARFERLLSQEETSPSP